MVWKKNQTFSSLSRVSLSHLQKQKQKSSIDEYRSLHAYPLFPNSNWPKVKVKVSQEPHFPPPFMLNFSNFLQSVAFVVACGSDVLRAEIESLEEGKELWNQP